MSFKRLAFSLFFIALCIIMSPKFSNGQEHHPTFDMDGWMYKFACDPTVESYKRRSIRPVATPYEMVTLHANRERLLDKSAEGKETDVFVWHRAEPSQPHLTKIGGVPYRTADKPWPTFDGKPMTFVGQLCFDDSKDLFDTDTPKVLLIFCSSPLGKGTPSIGYEDTIKVEVIDRLLSAEERVNEQGCPDSTIAKNVLHGHRARLTDYNFHEMLSDTDGTEFADGELGIINGTKIGGIGRVKQNDDRTFLCSVSAIPVSDFLTEKRVIKSDEQKDQSTSGRPRAKTRTFKGSMNGFLGIGDLGSLNFFVDSDGEIEVDILISDELGWE